ncbi:RnfH family protein [Alcanivorax sp. N3-2A]|nr:RnfH family protein [Alcanivorax sp. N3-2A]|tara:strand:- start:21326 stop:21634 length:309 start_codon:yes stop_codon:yes gene_type:complete
MDEALIGVEVVYALPDRQRLVALRVPPGTTMVEAARLSALDTVFEGLDLTSAPMGVFGKLEAEPATRVLRDGERVEIYRPLEVDPKAARRARARRAPTTGDA